MHANHSRTFWILSPRAARRLALGLAFALPASFGLASAEGAEPSERLIKALSYKPRQADVNYERVEVELEF